MRIKTKCLMAFLLILTMAFTNNRPLLSGPLPEGRTYDQAHDTGLIDWNGPVQYTYITHKDNTRLPPEEGNTLCSGGCQEWVTRISSGGSISGKFGGEVSFFKVLVAASFDTAVGQATLQACSASQSMYMYAGPGSGLPGFISLLLIVPAGCTDWTLSATGGYVDFRSVDANYSAILPSETPMPTATSTSTMTLSLTPSLTPTFTPTPLSPVFTSASILCDRWGNNGWCVDNGRLSIEASDPQGLPLTITGSTGQSFTCGASCIISLPEGGGTAIFSVTSSSGQTASGSLDWQYDASLPSSDLQLNSTAGVNGWYITTVNVMGIGTDAVSDVDTVEVSIDGSAWQPSATLSDGVYQVQTRAVDLAGWETVSAMQIVRVDTTAPLLSMILSGTEGSGDYYRSPVTVSLIGTDYGSGVAMVEYRLDGGSWVQAGNLTISTDGSHGLEGRVTDAAGNSSQQIITVRIDATPPEAVFVQPSSGSIVPAKGVIMLGGTVTDIGSGVESVELSLNEGETWQELNFVNDTWRYDLDTILLPNGKYKVFVRAKDIAGNTQSPASQVTIIAANQPPFVDVQEHWNIHEAGSLSLRENGGIPIERVIVTVRDTQGRWPDLVHEYSPDNLPAFILWDRRFGDGSIAPIGEYEVVVEVRDIYGNEASDRGMIVIPFVSSATTAIAPVTMTPMSTPSSTPTSTAAPAKLIEPAQVVFSTATPTIPPTPMPEIEPAEKPLPLWPVVGLIGLITALSSASLTDGRPRALASMKETFNQIMKNQGE